MGRFDALRWALGVILLGAGNASGLGCGKAPVDGPVTWYADVDVAMASGKAQGKPVVVYFGATWDTAAKELEHVTFVDAEVRWRLRRDFVSVHVDSSDDEAPLTRELQQRFKVIGDPTLVIMSSDGVSEIARFNEFIPPRVFAHALDSATRPDALQEAHYAAAARMRVAEAERAEQARKYELQRSGPTVDVPSTPPP